MHLISSIVGLLFIQLSACVWSTRLRACITSVLVGLGSQVNDALDISLLACCLFDGDNMLSCLTQSSKQFTSRIIGAICLHVHASERHVKFARPSLKSPIRSTCCESMSHCGCMRQKTSTVHGCEDINDCEMNVVTRQSCKVYSLWMWQTVSPSWYSWRRKSSCVISTPLLGRCLTWSAIVQQDLSRQSLRPTP